MENKTSAGTPLATQNAPVQVIFRWRLGSLPVAFGGSGVDRITGEDMDDLHEEHKPSMPSMDRLSRHRRADLQEIREEAGRTASHVSPGPQLRRVNSAPGPQHTHAIAELEPIGL